MPSTTTQLCFYFGDFLKEQASRCQDVFLLNQKFKHRKNTDAMVVVYTCTVV